MTAKPLEYLLHVQPDILDAAAWYESQKAGLGDELVAEIRSYLDKISQRPASFALVQDDPPVRHAVLKRFPFVIYFMEKENCITIIYVVHGKRSSRHWERHTR